MNLFFQRARKIEGNIDKYLDNITKAILTFDQGIKEFFNGNIAFFEEKYKEASKLESDSDELRRDIKYTLYRDLLIPDARGDVLGLLETLDDVIDMIEEVLREFSIEKPVTLGDYREDFLSLSEKAVKSAQELVSASRAFFRDIANVHDFITQVHYWEHEADKVEERIKRNAFGPDGREKLSEKVQIRYFAERISLLADTAEDVAERLDVYTIKRSI